MKRITSSHVKLKRAYEHPARGDGTRILIDLLLPRGVKKQDADEKHNDAVPLRDLILGRHVKKKRKTLTSEA